VQIALPVIVRTPDAPELQFRSWNPGMVLDKNHFGIDEPAAGEPVSLSDLDLVLLPLVAWDENGQRLGMGAGYYDRILTDVKACMRPMRVGVAYEAQKVPRVPTDPWDVRLHRLITEKGVFTCADESGTMPGNPRESGPANRP
jgi:5-formyltetrahydrofolate cyclo-ligase